MSLLPRSLRSLWRTAEHASSDADQTLSRADQTSSDSDQSHAAGGALFRQVFEGLQARLRPYDPIVRWGGDEFVCTVSGVIRADAAQRGAKEEKRG
jgi:PleD family two-component response regulator